MLPAPQSWQTTRNSYEACALTQLDIMIQPVSMRDAKSGSEYTDWNLAAASTVDPERHGRPFATGILRRDFNGGKLKGELAATPLHPFLIGVRILHNRARLLEAQRGTAMRQIEEAPGQWLLEPGGGQQRTAFLPPFLTTQDQDLTLALITCGHQLVKIDGSPGAHVYTLTRYSSAPSLPVSPSPSLPVLPRTDASVLMHDLRSGALWPARRWEPFAISIHTLHCLREMRRHQHSGRWITVSHRTMTVRGAAFPESASGDLLQNVQRKLGVKIG